MHALACDKFSAYQHSIAFKRPLTVGFGLELVFVTCNMNVHNANDKWVITSNLCNSLVQSSKGCSENWNNEPESVVPHSISCCSSWCLIYQPLWHCKCRESGEKEAGQKMGHISMPLLTPTWLVECFYNLWYDIKHFVRRWAMFFFFCLGEGEGEEVSFWYM